MKQLTSIFSFSRTHVDLFGSHLHKLQQRPQHHLPEDITKSSSGPANHCRRTALAPRRRHIRHGVSHAVPAAPTGFPRRTTASSTEQPAVQQRPGGKPVLERPASATAGSVVLLPALPPRLELDGVEEQLGLGEESSRGQFPEPG